jgi:hypothetical protein
LAPFVSFSERALIERCLAVRKLLQRVELVAARQEAGLGMNLFSKSVGSAVLA